MIQKSYEREKGNFYIIPTPIGNLGDITYRAVELLGSVDAIFAEDTRVTMALLNSLNLKNRVKACHKFNEEKVSVSIIGMLSQNKNVAFVTDRGTPLISDPGSVVVDNVIKSGYNVIALPGASAVLPALNMSNISAERFLFYGFLSPKDGERLNELKSIKDLPYTIVLYEAPHRFLKTLNAILEVFGDRKISVSREISKIHEEIFRGTVSEALKYYDEVKGEFVIVIEKGEFKLDYDDLLDQIIKLVDLGIASKDAIKKVAKENGASKNILYNMYEGVKR